MVLTQANRRRRTSQARDGRYGFVGYVDWPWLQASGLISGVHSTSGFRDLHDADVHEFPHSTDLWFHVLRRPLTFPDTHTHTQHCVLASLDSRTTSRPPQQIGTPKKTPRLRTGWSFAESSTAWLKMGLRKGKPTRPMSTILHGHAGTAPVLCFVRLPRRLRVYSTSFLHYTRLAMDGGMFSNSTAYRRKTSMLGSSFPPCSSPALAITLWVNTIDHSEATGLSAC